MSHKWGEKMYSDLEKIKKAMGVTGNFLDETLTEYQQEVEDFMIDAGVKPENIASGCVARGVVDLWNYGAGESMFSDYFKQRVKQLALR